jgi:hypothetical protein
VDTASRSRKGAMDVRTRRFGGSFVRLVTVAGVSLALAATVAAADSTKLKTALSGANEVPAADPDGRGSAEVVINAGQACFDVKVHDTGTPNRGHIHKEAPGVNGPIVVTFFELRPGDAPATDPRHDELEEGRLMRCVAVADPALLADIAANPDDYYVNLHNTRFPGGAVRGQLDD